MLRQHMSATGHDYAQSLYRAKLKLRVRRNSIAQVPCQKKQGLIIGIPGGDVPYEA
jgi:hypothetical protein